MNRAVASTSIRLAAPALPTACPPSQGFRKVVMVVFARHTESVVRAKVGVGMCLALPVILLVFLAAALVNGVALAPSRLLAMTVLLRLGTAPFVVIGIAVGYLFDTDSANIVSSGVLLVLAFLAELFVPMEGLPGVAQAIGYRFADLGWSVAASGRLAIGSALSLAAWTVVLGALALLSFRRAAVAR